MVPSWSEPLESLERHRASYITGGEQGEFISSGGIDIEKAVNLKLEGRAVFHSEVARTRGKVVVA